MTLSDERPAHHVGASGVRRYVNDTRYWTGSADHRLCISLLL